jgi:hypothetical protein
MTVDGDPRDAIAAMQEAHYQDEENEDWDDDKKKALRPAKRAPSSP